MRSDQPRQISPAPAVPCTDWPDVLDTDVPESKRASFIRRKNALSLLISGSATVQSICQQTGVSRTQLFLLRQRALTPRPDGCPWGWEACIPGVHIKAYVLRDDTTTGRAGQVGRFFRRHPELLATLSAWSLGKKKVPHYGVARGKRTAIIREAFRKECESAGIDLASIPSGSAINRIVRQIRRENYLSGVSARFGRNAALTAATGVTATRAPTDALPYRNVQFDGHPLDGPITLELQDAEGIWRDLPLERIWLLAIIDVHCRAVLGYHVSVETNYTADDVLECVGNALTAWDPMTLPSPKIRYPAGAGLPSGVIPSCTGRAWDTLSFDNHWAHLSVHVQEQIIRTTRCQIITGRPGRPMARPYIERFFGTWEELTLHRCPWTTGSSPADPRRTSPEKCAERYRVNLDDLLLITDVSIAGYNAAAHAGMAGQSPLERIRYFDDRSIILPRRVPAFANGSLPLFERRFPAVIRGNERSGRRPHVQFLYATYRSELLAQMIDSIGKPVTLIVNIKDLRTVRAFRDDGVEIGTLHADPPWCYQPHSLRSRRAIAKLMRAGILRRESQNPIGDFMEYFQERARTTRRARNKLLAHARNTKAVTETPPSSREMPTAERAPPSPRGRIRVTKTTIL